MTNSKQKGKRGELEFVKFLQSMGYEARRGQQYCGGKDSPDIICGDLHSIHFEVKRCEKINIFKALQQANEDSGTDQWPIVAHRRNRGEWIFILAAHDFFDMIERKK